MNLKQLLNKYTKLHNEEYSLNDNHVLDDLLEFEKELVPEVPSFVSDWYEENKDDLETNLFRIVFNMPKISENKKLSLFEEWLTDINTNSFQILINMHQFGYKIKKENRYLVKIKGIISSPNYLKHNTKSDNWFMGNCEETSPYRTHHTREELEKAGFKWVFFCEGVEVKKVE